MKHDLLPFLVIIMAFYITFSFAVTAMIYKPFEDSDITKLIIVFRNNFFAMFGEFDIADNVQEIGRLSFRLQTM